MKKVVLYDDMREIDFKPNDLLDKYMKITERDVKKYLIKPEPLKECDCPACQSKRDQITFSKFGLDYYECKNCGTLYISPRPGDKAIDDYYKNSRASKYWRETLSKDTETKRRTKIVKPRLQWIIDTVQEHLDRASRYVDINTSNALIVDEIAALETFDEKVIINPRFAATDNYRHKVKIIEQPTNCCIVEDKADVISLFEVIDRSSDINNLLDFLDRILIAGGLCFITTISISGFDLQMLRKESNSIFPPDRINVFSLEGIELLFERHGFECIELSTPGLLDVEIVASALKKNPSLDLPEFIRYLILKRGIDTHQAFQEFLQMNQLSSYVRAVFRKT